jgi:hypothetical protein
LGKINGKAEGKYIAMRQEEKKEVGSLQLAMKNGYNA